MSGRELIIPHAQTSALLGLTPDQARRRLEELGHFGPLVVKEYGDLAPYFTYRDCKPGQVCGTNATGGSFVDAQIELYVYRPKLDIPAPPP